MSINLKFDSIYFFLIQNRYALIPPSDSNCQQNVKRQTFWCLHCFAANKFLISFHLISSHLISSHLLSSHLISSHLISSHLIPSHLISSQWAEKRNRRTFYPSKITKQEATITIIITFTAVSTPRSLNHNLNNNPSTTITIITWPLVAQFVLNPFNQQHPQPPHQLQSVECLDCYGVAIPFVLIVSPKESLLQRQLVYIYDISMVLIKVVTMKMRELVQKKS